MDADSTCTYKAKSIDFMFALSFHTLCKPPYRENVFHGRQKVYDL